MKYLCRAYTWGGPVAIMRRSDVLAWNGVIEDDGGHYFAACNAAKGKLGIIMCLPDSQYPVTIFQKENEDFDVFYGKSTFAVISLDYVNPGHDMRVRHISFAKANRRAALGELDDFGGKVVIFDAALPGEWITLQGTGGEISTPPLDGLPRDFFDTALVEVSEGVWQVTAIDYEDEFLGYHGLLFRLLRHS